MYLCLFGCRIDTNGLLVKIKELFEGDRELLLGLNNFLPPSLEIAPPPENGYDVRADGGAVEDQEVALKKALSFVNKIKVHISPNTLFLFIYFTLNILIINL